MAADRVARSYIGHVGVVATEGGATQPEPEPAWLHLRALNGATKELLLGQVVCVI